MNINWIFPCFSWPGEYSVRYTFKPITHKQKHLMNFKIRYISLGGGECVWVTHKMVSALLVTGRESGTITTLSDAKLKNWKHSFLADLWYKYCILFCLCS